MLKKEYQNREKSFPIAVVTGTVISISVMLFGVFIVALLIMNQSMEESATGYGVMVITILSAMMGSVASILVHKSKVLLLSLCTSAAFMVILLAVTAMFFDGQYSGVPVTLLTAMGSGVAIALVAGKYLNRPKAYHKKRGKL